MNTKKIVEFRNTEQKLLPSQVTPTTPGTYDLYPGFPLGDGKIDIGYGAIAEEIADQSAVIIDGYVGILWDNFRENIDLHLNDKGINPEWIDISDYMISEKQLKELKKPFLGGNDPIFGTRYTGDLSDFYEQEKLNQLTPESDADIRILFGSGAALATWDVPVLYVDLPKNELQYRSRAGSVTNLGINNTTDPKTMYKQFYFVDWVALNKHKAHLVDKIDWIIDEQRPDEPAIMSGSDFRLGLEKMSKNVFRPRPWFEPGVWGGQWCREHITQLPEDVPNYAWSFEMIVPENGLIFSSDNNVLEVSFDWLMYSHYEEVLGESADQFGYEFPIRFDFLDTVEGENLSLQCHPKPSFIREQFGESFTQDETYYILDCTSDAEVYLGFHEDIDPEKFRSDLERSAEQHTPVEVTDYVQTFPAEKHDLFLIPHETIHCSGEGNLVLEISATPYIFTFKMYDWLRVDLDGNPRPINIERAFENLNFERKGKRVEEKLLSKPEVIAENGDSRVIHMPTHEDHFYDIHRLEFSDDIEVETSGSCNVMSLVEGSSIILETKNGYKTRFNYAETFTIPAAAENYRLINESDQPAKVVKAFVKEEVHI